MFELWFSYVSVFDQLLAVHLLVLVEYFTVHLALKVLSFKVLSLLSLFLFSLTSPSGPFVIFTSPSEYLNNLVWVVLHWFFRLFFFSSPSPYV